MTGLETAYIQLEILKRLEADYSLLLILVTLKYEPNNNTDQHSSRFVNKMLFYAYAEGKKSLNTLFEMEKDIDTWFSKLRRTDFMKSFRIVKDLESLEVSENYFSTPSQNGQFYEVTLFYNTSSSRFKTAVHYSDIRKCPKVKLSYKEFTLQGDNLVILLNDSRINLTMDRVEFDSADIPMICVSDYPGSSPNIKLATPDFVEILLSRVFLGISLLCLAMTLTTYAIFPDLRTLPGKCNIFLCCTLFTAQALFLFSFDNETACEVLGFIRHFAWLSTFSWMSVCSFHMYRVFTRILIRNDEAPNKTIVKYALTAYGLPLLVVVGTVVANMALYEVTVTGYGFPNCYLSRQLQLLLTFALPMLLMIIFNVSLLSTTIYTLYKTSKQCKLVNRDKRRVVVYLKLSALTGITWVFGIMSLLFPHNWIKYFFIITNASQGFYIFISYTFNNNVLQLYISKFSFLQNPKQHQTNINIYTTSTSTLN